MACLRNDLIMWNVIYAEWPKEIMGPLQLAIHVTQNRRAGEQKSHWDKTNKENYYLKLCMSFV